ncbi:hypothetical protein [Candidatus Neptunichlamydia sp. REUL1]|uniref:hypothetical protein n=1 Tax=Candidatus Neptunichlamydia sp. REUL1 TaxID=3064277 RepID=UPI00293111D1|nr:hypothetical protein [Candidatus Neptunochlamydia sp. REUL1]
MPNFNKMFHPGSDPKKWPDRINYKKKELFLFDRFPVTNRELLKFSIESTKSSYIQGFYVTVFDGYIKVNSKPNSGKRKYTNNLFWEDSEVLDIKNIEVKVFTKSDHICIGNIWEETIYEEPATRVYEDLRMESYKRQYPEGKKITCYTGAGRCAIIDNTCANAMYSEDIPNGKRYFCNDGDDDDDFNDIIFTVARINM